jgi:hypothetical protein
MRAYVPAILFATAVARCETLTDPQFRELAQRCVPDADLPTLRSIVKLTSGFEVNSVRLLMTIPDPVVTSNWSVNPFRVKKRFGGVDGWPLKEYQSPLASQV